MHADRPRTGPCVVLVNESLVRGQVVSVVVVRTTRFTNLRVPPPPPFPPLSPPPGTVSCVRVDTLTTSRAVQGLLWSLISY